MGLKHQLAKLGVSQPWGRQRANAVKRQYSSDYEEDAVTHTHARARIHVHIHTHICICSTSYYNKADSRISHSPSQYSSDYEEDVDENESPYESDFEDFDDQEIINEKCKLLSNIEGAWLCRVCLLVGNNLGAQLRSSLLLPLLPCR